MTQGITISHRSYLALAGPFIVSTITQPLLGAMDTAVIGRLDDPAYIGGVALGAVVFNTLYWIVGFLRVSTSGFAAQSLGSLNEQDKYFAYFRPVIIALAIGATIVILQSAIKAAALWIYHPEPNVTPHVIEYFNIVIWGAPLVLTGYVNLGWLMGRRLVRETLILQISTNVLNIVLDLIFVLVLEWGVTGVAWATLIAQAYGLTIGLIIISRKLQISRLAQWRADLMEKRAVKRIMSVNSDLMIRTFCLLTMTNMFMAKSSQLGVEMLAANAVLFQVQYLTAYFFDGLANATSVFSGKNAQEGNLTDFRTTIRITTFYIVILGLALTMALALGHNELLGLFTDLPDVLALCRQHIAWLLIFPLVIGVGLVYYGLFTGSTHTGPVRNSMLVALAVFVGTYFSAVPLWGNHGLWLSFILFSLTRSVYLAWRTPALIRTLFPE